MNNVNEAEIIRQIKEGKRKGQLRIGTFEYIDWELKINEWFDYNKIKEKYKEKNIKGV